MLCCLSWLCSTWNSIRDWIVRNKFLTCIIVFAVGLLVFGVVMVCRHWGWIVTESGSTIIRNLGLVIGGLIAIGFGIWRGVVADRQAKASQEQAKASLHQAETSQRGLLNERYQKGAEMLGSEVLSVRMGGIYALQRLAKDEPEQYHVQNMRLFCSFVRNPTKDEEAGSRSIRGVREDVQAVMTVIGTRSAADIELEVKEQFNLDLAGANLAGVNMVLTIPISANLANAILFNANLTGAHLFAANLTGAYLTRANLTGADLYRAKGLTQEQLDQACADPENPPDLGNLRDAENDLPLEWHVKPCR